MVTEMEQAEARVITVHPPTASEGTESVEKSPVCPDSAQMASESWVEKELGYTAHHRP